MNQPEPAFFQRQEDAPKNSVFVDAFERQIKELFFIKNHQYIGMEKSKTYETEDFSVFSERTKNSHIYVYFPWNNHLVKTVTKDDYLILKTNRNQDLITAEEQVKLRDYTVAVFGMSVGSNIAFILTQAGISNTIYVADFDELDTTNLNRILAGVHQVGVNKTYIAAQRIYEDNPFAVVETMPNGVTEENLETLLQSGKLRCIIEEIDEMEMKIRTRLLAIKYKIPVVMITDNGDGVVLHVERYDLGHDKIFGQSIEYWKSIKLNELSKAEAGKIIIGNIVGGPEKVDPKMMRSAARVMKKELVSWSQLGSSAILGGVVATVAVKRIALAEMRELDTRIHVHPVDGISSGSH